jgi:hypothetical protein
MNKYEKNIETLGLSGRDAINAITVTYKKQSYTFYTDSAGLDYFDKNADQSIGHELFCAAVDNYRSMGLVQSLTQAGAVVTPVKKSGKYNVYKIQGMYELWKLTIENPNGYLAGYVSNLDNLEYAIDNAEEEMRCLMAEAF